jgi:acetyl-CoA acetyltransferase
MKLARKVFVLGGANTSFIGKFHPDFIWKGHAEFGKKDNPTLEDYVRIAALEALKDAGLQPKDVQKGYVGNFAGELFSSQGHLGAVLASAHPDLHGKPFMRVEGACASGALALAAGIDAIAAGADVVLVVGAEVQTTCNAKQGAEYLARAAHFRTQRDIDPFTFPALFARRTKAYMAAHGVEAGDIAKVVSNAYANAAKNPRAHMRTVKMSVDQAREASDKNPAFLENPELKPFLKVSDCSQVSDGGSAIVLVSEAGLRKAGKTPKDVVEVASYGHATGPIEGPADLLEMETTRAAAKVAYEDAGIGPKDVQVAEVHDCFAIAQLLAVEALGFANKGQAKKLIDEGAMWLGGRVPVNTGGGLMAFGHPVGATGVKQAVELSKQLLGRAGEYQVKPQPKIGLAQNMGGDDRTAVVTVFKRA